MGTNLVLCPHCTTERANVSRITSGGQGESAEQCALAIVRSLPSAPGFSKVLAWVHLIAQGIDDFWGSRAAHDAL